MKRTLQLALFAAALALVACGPPPAKIADGKQGAAEALYAASGPTKGSTTRSQPIDVTLTDLNVSCQFGGSAILKACGSTTSRMRST